MVKVNLLLRSYMIHMIFDLPVRKTSSVGVDLRRLDGRVIACAGYALCVQVCGA